MISLIATVYNEENNIKTWLDSLNAQTRLPDEIVIVDGGSSDQTWDILREEARYNETLHVFQEKCNISKGRNIAIGHAKGDVIVATDAGCVYAPEWFASLAKVIEQEDVSFAATAFGPLLNQKDSFLTYLLAAATTPAPREFMRDWLPSSRSVAFSKKLWEKVGGYPEWLPICEDIVFDIKIMSHKTQIEYVREPLVFWAPRPTLGAYMKQLYRYTKSDGHAKLWPMRHAIRYITYVLGVVLFALSFVYSLWLLTLLFFGGVIYMQKFWKRWAQYAKKLSLLKHLFGYIVLIGVVFLGDLAKMSGWPIGVLERWRGEIIFEPYR